MITDCKSLFDLITKNATPKLSRMEDYDRGNAFEGAVQRSYSLQMDLYSDNAGWLPYQGNGCYVSQNSFAVGEV